MLVVMLKFKIIEMVIFDQEPEMNIDPGECEEINCFGDVAELATFEYFRWNGSLIFMNGKMLLVILFQLTPL